MFALRGAAEGSRKAVEGSGGAAEGYIEELCRGL